MNLVNLILVCSVASTPAEQTMLYQMAQTADQSEAYIDDLTARKVYDPARLREAAGIARALLESGHDIRVGLTQLNAREALEEFEVSTRELVDPCRNIAIGSVRLREARRRFPNRRLRALSWYFSGDPHDPVGLGWAHDVLQAPAVDVEHAATHPGEAPPSPGYGTPSRRIFPVPDGHNESERGRPRAPFSRQMFIESEASSASSESNSDDADTNSKIVKFPAPDARDRSADDTTEKREQGRPRASELESLHPNSNDSSASSAYRLPRRTGSRGGSGKRPLPPVTDEKLPVPDSSDGAE